MTSWLREDPSEASGSKPWAGALSIPMVAEVSPERTLRLQPHPNLEALRTGGPVAFDTDRQFVEVPGASRGLDIEMRVGRPQWRLVLTAGSEELLTVGPSNDGRSLTVTRPDHAPAATVPMGADVIRVVVDAGIVEIFAGDGACALRVPADRETGVSISGVDPGQLTIHRLKPAMTS